jgi:hypothetical protein
MVQPPREAEFKGWQNCYFRLKEKDFGRLIIEENKGKFNNLL